MRLKGKTVLITGTTSGIGAASARIFAEQGAELMLGARRRDEGEAVAKAVRDAGGKAVFMPLDVTDPEQVEAIVGKTVETYGKLDCLFNNAGGSSTKDGKVTQIDYEVFWDTIRLNLFGTFLMSRFAIPEIAKQGGGSVINNASYMGLQGLGNDAYSASKGGVLAMTRSMSVQFAADRIRVNAIAPRVVGTERIAARVKVDPLGAQAFAAQPFGLIPEEEVAHLAVYLASDESGTTSGQTYYMNGGAL